MTRDTPVFPSPEPARPCLVRLNLAWLGGVGQLTVEWCEARDGILRDRRLRRTIQGLARKYGGFEAGADAAMWKWRLQKKIETTLDFLLGRAVGRPITTSENCRDLTSLTCLHKAGGSPAVLMRCASSQKKQSPWRSSVMRPSQPVIIDKIKLNLTEMLGSDVMFARTIVRQPRYKVLRSLQTIGRCRI